MEESGQKLEARHNMHVLLQTISKYTGNACFVGETDYGSYVFEIHRSNQTLQYAKMPDGVKAQGLCYEKIISGYDSYIITTSDGYLYQYCNGIINTTYAALATNATDIIKRDDGGYYLIDMTNNDLLKWDSTFVQLWSHNLPCDGGCIKGLQYRGGEKDVRFGGIVSDGMIAFNDGVKAYLIRDEFSYATLVSSLEIPGDGTSMCLIATDSYRPLYTYARYRQVYGSEIDQDSSSSSSFSSSSDSTSSSLSSSSSTSSESTESFLNTSSSTSSSSSSSSSSESSLSSISSWQYSSSSTESWDNVSSQSGPDCLHLQMQITISGVPSTEDLYWSNSIPATSSPGYATIGDTWSVYWDGVQWTMLESSFVWKFTNSVTGENDTLVGTQADWVDYQVLGDTVNSIICMD